MIDRCSLRSASALAVSAALVAFAGAALLMTVATA